MGEVYAFSESVYYAKLASDRLGHPVAVAQMIDPKCQHRYVGSLPLPSMYTHWILASIGRRAISRKILGTNPDNSNVEEVVDGGVAIFNRYQHCPSILL